MSTIQIRVTGPGAFPLVAGAALAQRLRSGAVISIAASDGFEPDQIVLLRPDFRRFHAAISLDATALDRMGARPVFATEVKDARLPFERYGRPRGGTEFHHHWLRSRSLGRTDALEAFSPSLAATRRRSPLSISKAENLAVEHGLAIAHGPYWQILRERAAALGALITDRSNGGGADFTFEFDPASRASHWEGGRIIFGGAFRVPGLAFRSALAGAQRWLSLAASPANGAAEQREFNRLSAAEAERIADMEELLLADDPAGAGRPALDRKIAVFMACGRIPAEDYEVFSPHEWLAALLARGFHPARHDRLADAVPEAELLRWLDQVKRDVARSGSAA